MATALTPVNTQGKAGRKIIGTGSSEVAADVTGNTFVNDGKVLLVARNSGSTGRNITITTPGTVDGEAIGDPVYALEGLLNATVILGPFDPVVYGTTVTVTAAHAEVMLTAVRVA